MKVKQVEGYQIYMSKILGKGSFGSVYLGIDDKNNQKIAVKIIPKDSIDHDQYYIAALRNQIEILQKVKSENIVGFYEVMQSSNNYYLVQELCDGDLTKDIKRLQQYPEAGAIQMLKQICNGFKALVKDGIIHRDLKPANIMKKGNMIKIGDFGFAKQLEEQSQLSQSSVGTPLYMSLELLKNQKYTSKCDIWALGTIFYQILHGFAPWDGKSLTQLIKNIEQKPLLIKRKDLAAQTVNFLQRCLQKKEENRISWNEIFQHPIFQGYFIPKSQHKEFQNKNKMIMNKLRFYINKMNLDMKRIMDSMGFGQQKTEITLLDFYCFLQNAYPEITKEQAEYCFKIADTDNSKSISVIELQHLLVENGIKLESQFDLMPIFQKKSNQEQTFEKISLQTSKKIKSCFEKLYKIIIRNKLTLWKVFNDFDNRQGCLNLAKFSLLLKKLCGTTIEISDEEIKQGFKVIDLDDSGSIDFQQLNKYYSKINGIPAQIPHLKPKKSLLKQQKTIQAMPQRPQIQKENPEHLKNQYSPPNNQNLQGFSNFPINANHPNQAQDQSKNKEEITQVEPGFNPNCNHPDQFAKKT